MEAFEAIVNELLEGECTRWNVKEGVRDLALD